MGFPPWFRILAIVEPLDFLRIVFSYHLIGITSTYMYRQTPENFNGVLQDFKRVSRGNKKNITDLNGFPK